jgi:thiamine-phosphate pyrophosphorylase
MKSLSECLLYGFVDTAYLHGRTPAFVARQLCEGGADLIQLRAKDASIPELRAMAEQVAPITKAAGVGLVINDSVAIALEVGAEICHLGQEDFFGQGFTSVSQVRPSGSRLKIGLSTHSPEQAGKAIDANADYIAIGPVYATGTKPQAKPVTLEYVRWAAKHVKAPWFAIGGINLGNLADVIAAGAKCICVVSAILNTEDIAVTCRKYKDRMEAAAQASAQK